MNHWQACKAWSPAGRKWNKPRLVPRTKAPRPEHPCEPCASDHAHGVHPNDHKCTIKPKKRDQGFLLERPERPYIIAYLGGATARARPVPGLFPDRQRPGRARWPEPHIVCFEDMIAPQHVDRVPTCSSWRAAIRTRWTTGLCRGFRHAGGRIRRRWRSGGPGRRPTKAADFGTIRWPMAFIGGGHHGVRGTHGAWLHLRPGAVGWRGTLGRLVGVYVRRLCAAPMRWPILSANFGTEGRSLCHFHLPLET